MAETMKVYVNQDSPRAESEGVEINAKGTKRGELCVVDFYTQMALEGRVFQVRAGTVTAPLTGDILVTDTAADMCADAAAGTTIIPVYLNVTLEGLNGGTVPECAAKSVGVVSSAGTAFVPLPLYMGGNAAASTARVAAAGGVTVTAELATTTRRHFANLAAAAADNILADIVFRTPPVLVGAACFYVQVAGTTAGPLYFASFDYIELLTVNIS